MVETIVEPGVDAETLPLPVRNLLSKDLPLTNIDRHDRQYIRLLADNVVLYSREMYPPAESNVQGDVGAALLEEPDYNRHSLTETQLNNLESTLITMFSRASRGKGGWQQDKLSENITTRRVEDNRAEDDSGFWGRLFS